MIRFSNERRNFHARAFTLVEMLAVIAVMGVLLAVGVGMMRGNPAQARKAGMDMLQSAIEQARTHAITKRTYTVLAFVDPGDVPGGDTRSQRIGLFEVESWPEDVMTITSLDVRQIGRWRTFETGLILIDGDGTSGLANPLDSPALELSVSGRAAAGDIQARVLVFHPRGGIRLPVGSEPVTLRLAEGYFRDGAAVPVRRDGQIAESTLRVGRVIARPYRND